MEATRTLPASWYYSRRLQDLERRAIFLRSWFLLGPITKFGDDEDVHYEISQVPLVVRKSTESDNNNTVKVYADGREVCSHRTRTGLLFTTISSDAPSFDDFFPGLEEVLATVDFTALPHRRDLTYEGKYNWKTLMDGYQECLHCQYAHPAFSAIYPTTFYNVDTHANWYRHFSNPNRPDDGLFLYFFPSCTLNVYGGGMSMFRICPTRNPSISRMEFDYYHIEYGHGFEQYYDFVRQVAKEDLELCERTQANLEKGIYLEGWLNPFKESGVVHYQQHVLNMVLEQHERENSPGNLNEEGVHFPTSEEVGPDAIKASE